MNSANGIGPRAAIRAANSSANTFNEAFPGEFMFGQRNSTTAPSFRGAERRGISLFSILALRVARKHLYHVVVQAVVKLPLKAPRELCILDLFGAHQKNVLVDFSIRFQQIKRLKSNQYLDSIARRSRVKCKEWMFVSLQLCPDFFREGLQLSATHFLRLRSCRPIQTELRGKRPRKRQGSPHQRARSPRVRARSHRSSASPSHAA